MNEVSSIPKKLQKHKSQLESLFRKQDITGVKASISRYRSSAEFRAEWKNIWGNVTRDDGGKLSFATIGLLIGTSIGSVGIGTGGGAIGLPIALILGLGGCLSGSTFDSFSFFGERRPIKVRVRKELRDEIIADADLAGLIVVEFVEQILEASYAAEGTKYLETL